MIAAQPHTNEPSDRRIIEDLKCSLRILKIHVTHCQVCRPAADGPAVLLEGCSDPARPDWEHDHYRTATLECITTTFAVGSVGQGAGTADGDSHARQTGVDLCLFVSNL